MRDDYATLHVYPAPSYHDDVTIAGDAAALRSLRDAIDQALGDNEIGLCETFTNDGEGYAVFVLQLDCRDSGLMVPHYTDEDAGHPVSLTIDPRVIAYTKARGIYADR